MRKWLLICFVVAGVAVTVSGLYEDHRRGRTRVEGTRRPPREHQGRKQEEGTSHHHHHHHNHPHHGRHGSKQEQRRGRSRWLPEWAAPWLHGRVSLPQAFTIDWDLANFFQRENKEWWKGSNVCVSREESEEDVADDGGSEIQHHHFSTKSTCDETSTSYICTTEVLFFGKKKFYTVVYECCHGFERLAGQTGCPREVTLAPVTSTARDLSAGSYIDALTAVGLDQMLEADNYTIFLPEDSAFQEYGSQLTQDIDTNVILISPEVQEQAQATRDLLLAHVTPGILRTSKFTDEVLLETKNPRAQIRINIYDVPQKLVTANCKAIKVADKAATNGMLHLVDGVLQPVTSTLMELVTKDPELSTLKTMFGRLSLGATMRNDGQYTLFAPTNAAFRKLKPSLLQKLLGGSTCLTSLIENHLLPHVICSSVIQGKVKSRNMLSRYLNMTRSAENKVFVDGAQLVNSDIMATNGVLHIMDAVLMPDEALDVLDVAEKAGATEFLQLVDAAGLTKILQRSQNYTLFVPSNEAVNGLADDVKEELWADPMALEKMVKFHMVPTGERSVRHLYNNLQLETLDSQRNILIKEYYSAPFGLQHQQVAQCAPIRRRDLQGCNGIAHTLKQMMVPPKGDMFDVLTMHGNFSRLVHLVKQSGLADLLQQDGPFTMFAPTDQALADLDQNELDELVNQPSELRNFIEYHIMKGTLCCAGIFESSWLWKQRYFNLEGGVLHIRRNQDIISVEGESPVTRCDITATNGVVHALGQVLPEAWRKYTQLVHREDEDQAHRDSRGWDRNWERTWQSMRQWDWLDMGANWNN